MKYVFSACFCLISMCGIAQNSSVATENATTRGAAEQSGGYQEIMVYPVKVLLLDDKKNPIVNAEVVIFNPEKVVGKATTNSEGKAIILGVEDGDYDVMFKLSNGKNMLFNNQWIQTHEENERIYTIPSKSTKTKK